MPGPAGALRTLCALLPPLQTDDAHDETMEAALMLPPVPGGTQLLLAPVLGGTLLLPKEITLLPPLVDGAGVDAELSSRVEATEAASSTESRLACMEPTAHAAALAAALAT